MADISINAAWGGVQKGKTTTSQRHLAAARTLAMRWDGMGDGEERAPSVRASELVRESRGRASFPFRSLLSSPSPRSGSGTGTGIAANPTRQEAQGTGPGLVLLELARMMPASHLLPIHPGLALVKSCPKSPLSSIHYCTIGTQFLLIHGTPSVYHYRLHSCRLGR